ncbi:MAG: hypothetical protein ACLFSQ_10400 [Candidatus Zixiibacteriota bacterium]
MKNTNKRSTFLEIITNFFAFTSMLISTVFVVVLFVLIGYVIFVAIKYLIEKPEMMLSDLTIPFLILLIGGYLSARQALKTYKKQKLWEKKGEFYKKYVEYLYYIQSTQISGQEISFKNKKMLDKTLKIRSEICLWGNEEFLRIQEAMTKVSISEIKKPLREQLMVYLSYIRPIKVLRSEIGHKDSKVNNSLLLNLFVTDAEKQKPIVDDPNYERSMVSELKKIGIILKR